MEMLKNRSIPFGYCVVNGRFAVNENEAEIVRKIFADYIGGKSLKTIAQNLNEKIEIPYNSGKEKWNKNMVCRILENKKYIGENGFPQIISESDFKLAAQIKSERNTYRKPVQQANSQTIQIAETEYIPTEEIQRITNEINRLIDSENPNKSAIENLILRCAELKYTAIKEVRK